VTTAEDLTGRVAIVTAAAGAGVGGGIVRALHAAGATVVASDVHAGRVERLRTDLGIEVHVVDVGAQGAVEAHVDDVLARHGRLDVLVSCAGINVVKPAWELTEQDWRSVMEVNLNAPFFAARAALPAMIEAGRGVIVSIASVAAWHPTRRESAYHVSKAALVALTRALAIEAAPHGVRVNAIAPGFVENPFLANVYGPEHVERFRAQMPRGHGVLPEEIGATAAWLVSDAASAITGETVAVTGGFLFRP
jgi:3-oxoacyl-[acyl-carrier protein] reductase